MAPSTKNKEKIKIELNLTCSANEAIKLLSESVENFILPWFMTNTSIKGFIVNNKFFLWPNTLFSTFTETVLTGQIIQNEEGAHLSATARILPPFNLFPNKQTANWIAGFTMFFAWVAIAAGMVLDQMYLTNIFGPIFMISCLYILIQFTKYIQKPELVDFEKRFRQIFKNHIKNS
jgi:hypothetical protein